MSTGSVCLLDDLGVLRFSGSDARKFLQGQLSNDVSGLRADALLRAGLHNPQGRTLALLALYASAAEDEVQAVLPLELLASVAATLARYVLRSKVKISDVSGEHRVYGVTGPPTTGTLAGYDPQRGLVIARASEPAPAGATLQRAEWRALDIAAGLPQVYRATSEQFVAQMLNLDCIGAISFNKGCYTGQEVIARAHYRGRVKRRMQRFLSDQPLPLSAGDVRQLTDGRSIRVVDSVQRPDGRSEFLAIAPLAPTEASPAAATEAVPIDVALCIAAQALPLPYALPE